MCGVIVAVFVAVCCVSQAAGRPEGSVCFEKTPAKYELSFIAEWSPESFPKQYPTFRPHAQWSKVIGRTHNDAYSLFEIGRRSTPQLQEFAEKGTTGLFDLDVQGSNGVLDVFNAKNMDLGIGTVGVDIFVDPSHTKVSAISKIVPSPDWFVGISNLDLCRGGTWVKDIEIDLDPLDGGTDQGYTYTSPNWPEFPQKPISIITSKEPSHPANSFFNPMQDKLPRIGQMVLRKTSMMSEDENFEESSDVWDDSLANEIESELSSLPVGVHPSGKYTSVPESGPPMNVVPQMVNDEQKQDADVTEVQNEVTEDSKENVVSEKPVQSSNSHGRRRKLRNRNRNRQHSKIPQNCEVGDWSEWSPCSKSCGYGNRSRVRDVIQPAKNGGGACPQLREEEICGSMRTCGWKHFSFGGFQGFGG